MISDDGQEELKKPQMTQQERDAIMQYQEEDMNIEMEFEEADPQQEQDRANALRETDFIVRALNVLKSLFNSVLFFSAATRHAEILSNLAQLLASKNSLVALLAGQVIKAILHHKG